MLVRGYPLVLFVTISFVLLLFVGQHLYRPQIHTLINGVWPGGRPPAETVDAIEAQEPGQAQEPEGRPDISAEPTEEYVPYEGHQILYSQSTADKTYIKINTGDHSIYNANIIPYAASNDTWIVSGQKGAEGVATWHFSEIWCEAALVNDQLTCIKSPLTLTIPASHQEHCPDSIGVMNFNLGPHDARMFFGPEFPIVTYGDNSAYTCFGQFAVDLRSVMPWPFEFADRNKFRHATELQRPFPYGKFEKNWFMWWDSKGDMYAHYNIQPRVFSKIEYDGTASESLAATATAADDEKCLAKYVPPVHGDVMRDSIHQATNSLSLTLCKRADPSCSPTEENTYTIAVFQHKRCRAIHNVYSPYAMVFKQDAPFTLYGISEKPLWINGRGRVGEKNQPEEERQRPDDESEMIYVTSMSWKDHGQKSHGYLDDVLFLAFGLEDYRAGGIDILASDLIDGLGLCSEL